MAMPVYQVLGPCPCQTTTCDVMGTKLTRRGHLVGCRCPGCTGARNRDKGRRAQTRLHRHGGGQGYGPGHEESSPLYEFKVRAESKRGRSIPRHLPKLLETEFFRRALLQAENSTPAGARSGVYLEPGGGWEVLIVVFKRPSQTRSPAR